MLSIAILGMTVGAVSSLFSSGLQALEQGEKVALLDSELRSQMETLISRPFGEVLYEASGSQPVTVGGDVYTATWSATRQDLDGDGALESDAMVVEVSLAGRLLSVLLVDNDGQLGEVA